MPKKSARRQPRPRPRQRRRPQAPPALVRAEAQSTEKSLQPQTVEIFGELKKISIITGIILVILFILYLVWR